MTVTTPSPVRSRVIAVTPELITYTGDGNAAIFMAQVLFWWRAAGRRRFYKFNSPCTHPLYKAGDSWTEELCFKRAMFATARGRVAAKVRISDTAAITAAFAEGVLVVFGTDEHHVTWYEVNELAVQTRLPRFFATWFETATARQPAAPPVAPVCPTSAASGSVKGHHSPMQGTSIRIPSENTSELCSETAVANTTSHSEKNLLPTAIGEEGETLPLTCDEIAIFLGLQERGVQDDPARLIANRAAIAGLDTADTLLLFDAHVLDAERAGMQRPIGVAVARLVKNTRFPPAPEWALVQVRRRQQEQAWEGRQSSSTEAAEVARTEVGEVEEDPAEDAIAANASTTQTLWQQVLGDIRLQVTRATFTQHFTGTWLEQEGNTYVVRSRDAATVEWLEHRLHRLVSVTLQRWVGQVPQMQFACHAGN